MTTKPDSELDARNFTPRKRAREREARLIATLTHSGRGFYLLVAGLLAVIAVGAYAYYRQLSEGLVVTGMRHYVFWGLYMTNFVFFIGISHAGTLISAILRVTGAGWRTPITRMAEAITVFALLIGAPMILIDMGRPDRVQNVLLYGRIQSAILWDVISITTYITGSLLYLYIPMIPDMAILRDGLPGAARWRKKLYTLLALNWHGAEAQEHALEKAVSIMAVLIIPIAVSVHTVVSWIFGMTLRPGWHSTIFGPYFVVGAIFGGIAALLLAMAFFRRALHLEEYVTVKHFRYLGILFLVMDAIYLYFTFAEYLTSGYTSMHPEAEVLGALMTGRYAVTFWGMVLVGFLLPGFMLSLPLFIKPAPQAKVGWVTMRLRPALGIGVALLLVAGGLVSAIQPAGVGALIASVQPTTVAATSAQAADSTPYLQWAVLFTVPVLFMFFLPEMRAHPIATTTIAAALVTVAMWLKRYLIIVPTLENPYIPIPPSTPADWAHYLPSGVEWAITAAAFALFILLYVLFSKVFPIVSLWETREPAHVPAPAHPAAGALAPEMGD
ncbi:MAG: polysulfide reductase NrfD [Chloroflexi bacterium]|nr:polysulfide reductase NrfD [Chloroflexota bacterium]